MLLIFVLGLKYYYSSDITLVSKMSQWCHIIFTEMLRKVREKSAEEGPTYSIGKAKGTFNVTFITNSSTTETTFYCTTTIKPLYI